LADLNLDLPLVAISENTKIGLAWGKIFPNEKNTAYVFQMWANPNYRRSGVGKALLDKIIDWASAQQVEQVVLGVALRNSAAIRLYKSAGFDRYGVPKSLRAGSKLLEQEYRLQLPQSLPIR